jgi:hypothetical protein
LVLQANRSRHGGREVIKLAPRHRSAIVNYPTRYEITMTANGIETVLGYTRQRTRSALYNAMLPHKEAILAALGTGDFGWNVKTFSFENEQGFRIGFSGRTERQAADA